VLTILAWKGEEAIKSEQLAESVRTNPVVIRRILCALHEAELVLSQTGAAGGSRLARRPSQITLLEVYRAVEGGGVFALHHRPPSRRCLVGCHIETVLGGVLAEVNLAVERVLARTTLEQVLLKIHECAKSATQR
jgi:Rrf2 family protein